MSLPRAGSEIHSRLAKAEQELELLRVEVEALETDLIVQAKATCRPWTERAEKERVISMAGRLAEDLK